MFVIAGAIDGCVAGLSTDTAIGVGERTSPKPVAHLPVPRCLALPLNLWKGKGETVISKARGEALTTVAPSPNEPRSFVCIVARTEQRRVMCPPRVGIESGRVTHLVEAREQQALMDACEVVRVRQRRENLPTRVR
jgi:hypothetical protein